MISPGNREISPAFVAVPPAEVLIASDYDGTIAPIVDDPAAAFPWAAAVEHLRALVPMVRAVAIISGRSEQSLSRLLAVPGVILMGENGVGEITPTERARLREFEHRAMLMVARWPGVVVEAKPASVSVHFRARPLLARELERGLVKLIAGTGLAMVENRRVFDVQLKRGGKLRSMERLVREWNPGAVFYAGDGRDDARVLRCLARLGRPALAVGVASDELPASILKSANTIVQGPPELADLLGLLVRGWDRHL
ncbi:MAG: trehalose-phosphatase [Candidatus Dormibacterales bacterium]